MAALGVAAASFALTAYALSAGRVGVPRTNWTLIESRRLLWASAAGLVALGLVCLLVAVGGLFALHEDAQEGRGR